MMASGVAVVTATIEGAPPPAAQLHAMATSMRSVAEVVTKPPFMK